MSCKVNCFLHAYHYKNCAGRGWRAEPALKSTDRSSSGIDSTVTHSHLTPIPGVSAVRLTPALGMQSVRTFMQVEPSYIEKNMNNSFLKQ